MRTILLTFSIMLAAAAVCAGERGKPAADALELPSAVRDSAEDKSDAQAEDSDGKMITVNFRDTEIVSVIDYYSKMLGKTFILDNRLKGKVTVISPAPIPREKALAMLDTILSMQGYGLVEADGYIKIVQRDKITRDIIGEMGEDTPSDRIVSEVITLQFVAANSLLEQIRPLLSSEGNVVLSEHLNTLIVTDTAGNISKIKKIIASLDKESRAIQTRVYRLRFATAEKLSSSLPNLLSGGEKSGGLKANVAIDAENNALIISGTPLMQKRMEELLPALDKRKGQVLIEAKIVEVSHTVTSRFGFEWETAGNGRGDDVRYGLGLSNYKLDESTLLDGVSGMRLSFVKGNNWTSLLNAYSTSEDVNLLSNPHLVAMDGQTAKLHVGEEIPILKESRVDSNNNPVNSYDYEKVGIDLSIKPKILSDGEVMLEIKQEISTILQYNAENLTHRIGERLAETSVILKDRHTLVIGGLLKDSVRKSSNGLPVLKNVPVIGKLFSQQTNTDSPEKTELLIFITPRLIDSPEKADHVSDEMKERHPSTFLPSGEEFRL